MTAPPVLQGDHWVGCRCCGWVGPVDADPTDAEARLYCARCGHALAHPQAEGLQRVWALLIAASVLMLPANLLPMMSTVQALQTTPHTLLAGIAELWLSGDIGLAALVFVASIVVPILKIGALALLAWTVQCAPHWRPLERSRLYRLVQAVGHWSMLDVYVVVLLVGMVRFGNLAGALPGAGLVAFAATVVLTMVATQQFDPRWIWPRAPRPLAPPPAGAVGHG